MSSSTPQSLWPSIPDPLTMFARGINHLLRQEPWAASQLAPHTGKTLEFVLSPMTIKLALDADGWVHPALNDTVAVRIELPLSSLPQVLVDGPRAALRSVKLEGGVYEADRVRAIARAGIPVVGHIGVTPQTAGLGPGFKMQTHRDRLVDDARAIESAGAYAIVLEVVDHEISREITAMLSIPTIGIGSGPHCDSQVLVLHDILGMYSHSPRFAKRYAEIGRLATEALTDYANDVREGTFPAS